MLPSQSRSRALWDEARMPNAPREALLHAILYELQPIRFSSVDVSAITSLMHSMWSGSVSFVTGTVPSLVQGSYRILRSMTGRQWMIVGAVVAYYYLVRFVHRLLDAGPILVIATALVTIFTIGLGDTATQDGLSAYSVFNRGYERILGSIDAESLVQQHVGGAMGFAGMELARLQPVPPIHEPAPRPRQDVDNHRQENVARAPAVDEDDAAPERGVSRKSGKKARRRNLEQRRELQQQRQAAMAMGFTGDEGHEEMVAIQRLLEEEIAANDGYRE